MKLIELNGDHLRVPQETENRNLLKDNDIIYSEIVL
jgi:hypothetical protein